MLKDVIVILIFKYFWIFIIDLNSVLFKNYLSLLSFSYALTKIVKNLQFDSLTKLEDLEIFNKYSVIIYILKFKIIFYLPILLIRSNL